MSASLKDFTMSPYSAIQHTTRYADQEAKEYVVCKGGLEVSEGKHIANLNSAVWYARGLIDGGYKGIVTIRYVYE